MSSLPSPEGVAKLRALAFEYRKLETEEHELRECFQNTKLRLRDVGEELARTRNSIIKALEGMDCASRGNTGWEGRITWMLSEMTMQGYNAAAVQRQPDGQVIETSSISTET